MAPPPPPPDPGAAPPPPPAYGIAPPRWRSLDGLTTALAILLYASLLFIVLGVAAYANRISVINDLLDLSFDADLPGRADDADSYVGAAVIVLGLLAIAISVLMIIWTFRAMKNNEYLGRWNARFTPGWGIAGWLIPCANFVIPVLIFQDLWRGSDASVPRGDPNWRQARGSGLVGWWWAAYLLSAFRFGIGSGEADDRDELETLRASDSVALVGLVVSIASVFLWVRVLKTITARQLEVRDKAY
jgi:hypothetical protein